MAIHSSTIAWKIPWTEEPGRQQSMGSQDTSERLHFHYEYFKDHSYRITKVNHSLKLSCHIYRFPWGKLINTNE